MSLRAFVIGVSTAAFGLDGEVNTGREPIVAIVRPATATASLMADAAAGFCRLWLATGVHRIITRADYAGPGDMLGECLGVGALLYGTLR
jgi:hypothetical protein